MDLFRDKINMCVLICKLCTAVDNKRNNKMCSIRLSRKEKPHRCTDMEGVLAVEGLA